MIPGGLEPVCVRGGQRSQEEKRVIDARIATPMRERSHAFPVTH